MSTAAAAPVESLPLEPAEVRRRAAAVGLTAAAVLLQDGDGVVIGATDEAAALLGLTAERLLGPTFHDPLWAVVDDQGRSLPLSERPSMRAVLSGEVVREAVIGVRRPGGAVDDHVWLLVTSAPVSGTPDAPGAVLSAFVELPRERSAELALAQSERMFRFIAENATDMVAWQLPDTTFLWVSPASETLLGLTPAELVGRRSDDLVRPEDVEAGRTRRRDGGTPLTVRMRHTDGREVWVEVSGRVVHGEDGAPDHLRTAWRDVTARVRAERERDAALRLISSTVDRSPIGIGLRGLDGPVLRANPALCEMLGRTSDAIVGRSLRDFAHPHDVPPDDQDPDGVHALVAGDIEVHVSERRYLRGDGTTMWGHRTAVLLRDDDGHPEHVLLQLQDVTARHEAVDELARAARSDPLTGLANRGELYRATTEALVHGRTGALFVDLDRFKPVNDTLGHEVGDEVLRVVAQRLASAVREGDLVARLGGDEFVVLCRDVPDEELLAEVAARIVVVLARPVAAGPHRVALSASVGAALAEGADESARSLLARADAAMYRVKHAGTREHALDGAPA